MTTAPYAPGTELLVRFPTRAHKRFGEPGATYLSRQATNLAVGTVLEVVEDFGKGYLWVRQGQTVFQVHSTDLMPKPDYAQVAHQAVQGLIKDNLLTDTEGALKLVEAKVVDLRQALAEATAANGRLQDERDAAREAAGIANQARLEAEKWVANLSDQRNALGAECDRLAAQVKTLNTRIRKGVAQLQGLPE